MLLDDEVDLCFARRPLDTDGLHAIALYDEVAVVWMSKGHELTVLDEVSSADLVDFRVIDDADADSIELASYSAAVLRVPMSIARAGNRRDMVYRPLVDAAPTTVALAWRRDNDTTKERGDTRKPARSRPPPPARGGRRHR